MAPIWKLLYGHPGTGPLVLAVLCWLGANLSFAADRFVRCDGDDSAPGTNRNAAWRTVERVNRARLEPGDRVLFQAGRTFAGNLRLTAEDAGTATLPLTIGSLGDGRATIFAGAGTGVSVENAGGIVIENLVVVGAGITNNGGYGVLCNNTLTNATMLDHLVIDNVEVSGFGKHGILITGAPAGFRHVRVSHCVMRGNLLGGMEIAGRLPWDAPNYAHADVQVTQCQAFDNTGDPDYHKNHSGSGIVLYEVDGGLIDGCVAWNNGALNGSGGGGPVGLWGLALLAAYAVTVSVRRVLSGLGWWGLAGWYLAAVLAALATALALTVFVAHAAPSLLAVFWQLLATLALYPLAYRLIERFEDADVRFR